MTSELLDLPTEMLHKILAHLDNPTHLTLRLVSRRMREVVDSSGLFQDVHIHLHRTTLRRFLDTAPPSLRLSHFSIDLDLPFASADIPAAYDRVSSLLTDFAATFGPHIRTLWLSHMLSCTFDPEFQFFQSLPLLSHLKIQTLKIIPQSSSVHWKPPRVTGTTQLLSLVVQMELNAGDYLISWVRRCPSLQHFRLPRSVGNSVVGAETFGDPPVRRMSMEALPYVLRLGAQDHLQHLQALDFDELTCVINRCSDGDARFFQELISRRVRLLSVHANFLGAVRTECIGPNPLFPLETFQRFIGRVTSARGIPEVLKEPGFLHLEDLAWTYLDCPVPTHDAWDLNSPGEILLPRLRKIVARICSQEGWDAVAEYQDFLERLFRPQAPRGTVTDLQVCLMHSNEFNPSLVPSHLDLGFPNLTRLVLRVTVFETNELIEMVEVISRKQRLEELSLVTASGIPEEAFFGRNPGPPIFLRLTGLRKLLLNSKYNSWDLGDQPRQQMGDGVLGLLAQMPLTHLIISGMGWETVTREGLRTLREGVFGESVLWPQLKGFEGFEERLGELKALEVTAHGNRVKKRLTCGSFEEFKAAESSRTPDERFYPFRKAAWDGLTF